MFEQVKQMLVDDLSIDEALVLPEAELQNDLGVNSLELADLVMGCEDKFNIKIDDTDLEKFVTVNDIVTYLEAHIA